MNSLIKNNGKSIFKNVLDDIVCNYYIEMFIHDKIIDINKENNIIKCKINNNKVYDNYVQWIYENHHKNRLSKVEFIKYMLKNDIQGNELYFYNILLVDNKN
jgi:phage/plasmid-associated DNA primase